MLGALGEKKVSQNSQKSFLALGFSAGKNGSETLVTGLAQYIPAHISAS